MREWKTAVLSRIQERKLEEPQLENMKTSNYVKRQIHIAIDCHRSDCLVGEVVLLRGKLFETYCGRG